MNSLNKIVQYLLDEADFNRSWADGRRSPPAGATPGYYARRIELAEEREKWVRDLNEMMEQMDQILELDDVEPGENVASAVGDALGYLRAQWRTAEEQVEKYRRQLDARCGECVDGEDASRARIAALESAAEEMRSGLAAIQRAAEERGAREFAEWATGRDGRMMWEMNKEGKILYTISEAFVFYLAARAGR